MIKPHTKFLIVMFCLFMLEACVGGRTFHDLARAGDTVAVAAGRKTNFSKDNITVTITPSSGNPIVYAPNNPSVRAVINLYPDPVSSLLVSMETQQDLTPSAQYYGNLIFGLDVFSRDKDWWTTSVFVDLPANLPVGTTQITISNPWGEYVTSVVEIVDGTGTPNKFNATWGPLYPDQLAAMQRIKNFTVDFSGSTRLSPIPFAIQIDLLHSPDVDHGGTGRAYVINPRGDLKNVTWSDTGTNMRVIIIPTKAQTLSDIHVFKFYVAGGVTNLTVLNVKAVDIYGNIMPDVMAMID